MKSRSFTVNTKHRSKTQKWMQKQNKSNAKWYWKQKEKQQQSKIQKTEQQTDEQNAEEIEEQIKDPEEQFEELTEKELEKIRNMDEENKRKWEEEQFFQSLEMMRLIVDLQKNNEILKEMEEIEVSDVSDGAEDIEKEDVSSEEVQRAKARVYLSILENTSSSELLKKIYDAMELADTEPTYWSKRDIFHQQLVKLAIKVNGNGSNGNGYYNRYNTIDDEERRLEKINSLIRQNPWMELFVDEERMYRYGKDRKPITLEEAMDINSEDPLLSDVEDIVLEERSCSPNLRVSFFARVIRGFKSTFMGSW